MIEIGLLLGFMALALCFIDWRRGVLLTVAVGFLADPVRKLLPGEPVVLTVAVAAFVLASLAGAFRHQGWGPARSLLRQSGGVRRPLRIFVLWVLFAALMTIVNFGSMVLAGIGVVAYLSPLPGVVLAYYFGGSLGKVNRFALVYVGGCVLMASGIFLQQMGFDWAALGQVGEDLVITRLGVAYGGFFRVPEVAAWHCGAAICLLIVLGTSVWRQQTRPIVAILIVFLFAAGLMTGRRKMVAQILLFGSVYWLILVHFRRESKRLVRLGLLVVFVGAIGANELMVRSQAGDRYLRYFRRGTTVLESAPQRMEQLGLGSVLWAVRRHGVLGSGAGVSSQGAQHFGGGVALVGGAGEGGLGKIVTELGIPGLLLSLWLAAEIFRTMLRDLGRLARRAPPLANLVAGLVAVLVAQVPTFAVASQVYGDPFVLVVLGFVLGLVFAISSWSVPEPLVGK